jgi:hypothetical protein
MIRILTTLTTENITHERIEKMTTSEVIDNLINELKLCEGYESINKNEAKQAILKALSTNLVMNDVIDSIVETDKMSNWGDDF